MPRTLTHHDRFPYRAIVDRPDFDWPDGKRLAVYIGLNFEHFDFGRGHGAALAAGRREPDALNYAWREYGNRVGAWRLLILFESLGLPVSLIVNSTIVDHCPELVAAYRSRLATELIAHGRSNSESQNEFYEAAEAELIAESPDLLAEAGFDYHLDWCHDDQPSWMATRDGGQIRV